LKVLGCDRKCESCPLMELCGGIKQYGVKGYRCPMAGCELKFPALKRMEECSACRHIRVAWDLKEGEVANLVSEVKGLKPITAHPPELPAVVPIVSLNEPASYDFGPLAIDALIVMFEDLFDEEIRSNVEKAGDIHSYLNYDGKVLASSIMPDDLITGEDTFHYFLGTVDRLKFDGTIAWDSPVYIDIPLYDSWVNLLMGLKLTHELADWGMPVYGLVKGNLENQIKFSIETLARIGIDSMALHTSEYMVDFKVDGTVRQVLYTYSSRLSESAKSVLLVGALNPRWLSYVEDAFPKPKHPKLSIAGLSHFLDAERGRIYSTPQYVDTTKNYAQCKCSVCSSIGPTDLMIDLGARARHNLNYVIDRVTKPSGDIAQLAKYDLILQGDEKVLIVSDLHMWTGRALLDNFLAFLEDERPTHIVFLGDIFDLKGRPDLPETAAFFETLKGLGSLVFITKGCSDSDQGDFLSAFDRLAMGERPKPMLWTEVEEGEDPSYTQACLDLHRFYRCAKERLDIKLADGGLIVAKHGHDLIVDPAMPLKQAVKELEEARAREHARWLIVGHLHRSFLDEEKRVASTGCWAWDDEHETFGTRREDLMTSIVVHGNGKVELKRRG